MPAHRNSALGRYRQSIRDGADPEPYKTEMVHRSDASVVLRTPSTVYGGQFRDAHPDMPWLEAWDQMRVAPGRPDFLDVDEAYAGFHRKR